MTPANNATLKIWDPATGNTTTGFNTFIYGEGNRSAAIDPIRGRILLSNDVLNNSWKWHALSNGASTNVDPGAALHFLQGSALEWDTIGNRYIYYSEGQTAYAIDPVTFVGTSLNFTGTPAPNATPNAIFSKMRFVPELGGLVFLTNATNNVYFVKLYNSRYT